MSLHWSITILHPDLYICRELHTRYIEPDRMNELVDSKLVIINASPLSALIHLGGNKSWLLSNPHTIWLASCHTQKTTTLNTPDDFHHRKGFHYDTATSKLLDTYYGGTLAGEKFKFVRCSASNLCLPKLTFDLKKCGKLYVFNSPPPQGGNFLTLFFSTLNPSLSGNILYLPLDSAQSSVHVLLFIQLGRWSHMWLEWGAGR